MPGVSGPRLGAPQHLAAVRLVIEGRRDRTAGIGLGQRCALWVGVDVGTVPAWAIWLASANSATATDLKMRPFICRALTGSP